MVLLICVNGIESRADNLNDFMDNPTAENLVSWMWERLHPKLDGLKELRLWETPEYCVAYRGD